MTEDEAFVRAIVDSPGDDTPRLVYADWLDDHSDPRGRYLRHELEWAKPWKRGTPPGWSDPVPGKDITVWEQEVWNGLEEMRGRAAGLDPVWVARVSRPPAGVCCDHLEFRKPGPQLTIADVVTGETRIGHRFPPALTAFLLNYNGGEPSPDRLVYRISDADGWDWVGIDSFGQLRPAAEAGTPAPGEVVWTLEALRDEVIAWREDDPAAEAVARSYLVPGRYAGYCFLLMQPSGQEAGAMFGLDPDDEEQAQRPLAPSLPELLARIITNTLF
jgi:uncharacterized protein (TIGR02996 family)